MPIKVLLVDDDDAFRAVTAIALESEGCEVQEAENGWDALAAVEAAPPDVVVSDLDMPGLNGVELCQRIRAHPGFANLPFVLLSALIEPDGTGCPASHQADCCLSKQTHFRQLYRHIESLAQTSHPHLQ